MHPPAGFIGAAQGAGHQDVDPLVVRVKLLGGFRVSVGSRTIGHHAWRLRKASSLVKLLALAPSHRLHRERAMDLLWPERDVQAQANNLRQTLYAARKALGVAPAAVSPLRLVGEELALCPNGPLWTDVGAFEEAAKIARRSSEPAAYGAAVQLYAGDLLPEDRYEEWAESRREQLRRDYLALLVDMARLYEEREEFGPAAEAFQTVVRVEPTHEEAHVGLMRLNALTGRRHQAIEQYEQLREVLSRELGAEPDASSRRLHRDIAAGRFPPNGSRRGGRSSSEPAVVLQHNLPGSLTSFAGRERELTEIKRELGTTRLLTLTGVGGSGKTRLAMEVAKDLAGAYPDGVWLVELAALPAPDLVPQAVATVLGVHEGQDSSLTEALAETLANKTVLLVLDNCEHLVDACAQLAGTLLGRCPGVRILATSREALGVAGEARWMVPSMSVPEAQIPHEVEELAGFESVRLFLERAKYRRPDFVLTPHNVGTVAEVCRRLDGIPLAIELAAARVGVLSVEQIAERLGDSLKLLTTGDRTATPRHWTLRNTLEWGQELLSESERKLFARLSVFAGGWTLEASEAVGAGGGIQEDEVLDLLSKLVDKSLVVAGESGGGMRYRMLEPVRQFAREQLSTSGEASGTRRRRAEFYLAVAEAAEPELTGPRQRRWLGRLEREHGNLRAALSWSFEYDAELGLRLGAALWRFWYMRGYISEGRRWLEEGLGRYGSVSSSVRAKGLSGAGWLAELQGDNERARAAYEERMQIFRRLGDEAGIASALGDLGSMALQRGEHEQAKGLLEESQGLLREQGDKRGLMAVLVSLGNVASSQGDTTRALALSEEILSLTRESGDTQGTAIALGNLGFTTLVLGDHERAGTLFEESIALSREAGDTVNLALGLCNLATAALGKYDCERATELLEESLTLARELGDKLLIAGNFEGLAAVSGASGKIQRTARLWVTAQALREGIGAPLQPDERAMVEPYLVAARSRVEDAVWDAAWTGVEAMELEEAVEYALSEWEPIVDASSAPERRSTGAQPSNLTAREREIAAMVARGLTNRRIASELSISEHTVATHVTKIFKKLGLRSRAQIGSWLSE